VPAPGEALVHTAVSLVSAGTERMLAEFAGKSLLGKARSRPDLVRQMLEKARREGVLGTLEAAFSRLDQSMALGYASAGTIQALGLGLTGFKVSDRVACAGGGHAVHAEYATVPQNLMARLPDSVDFESAAFTTLGAIAMHGFRLAEVYLGERVAVIGLGLLGQLTAGVARAAGCYVLGVDVDPRRVALAVQMGAQAVLREGAEEAALSFSQGRGCDAVLICAASASSDPVELAGIIARDRARVVAVGAVDLHLPRKPYYEKELTFLVSRSYGPGRYDPGYEEAGHDYPIGYVRWTEGRNMQAFVELLAEGRIDVRPLVSHRFPVERAAEAYALITGKQVEPYLGVLLTYPPEVPGTGQTVTLLAAKPRLHRDVVVKLGVLGAGNFAWNVMLPAISHISRLERVGIASASGLSARRAADRYGFCYATSDEAQVINDPEVNTVAILTRHNQHARQVLAAWRAGKHVFCEKPLAIAPGELDEVEQEIWGPGAPGHEANVEGAVEGALPPHFSPLLMVGFNRRFAPLARRMSAFLGGRSEPFVAHYRVNAGLIPLGHWVHDLVQGGGRIVGEGCHFIDFLSFLAGGAPVDVRAQGLPDGGRYCEDNAVLTFTFPDGSLGTVEYLANGAKAFPKERLEVFCGGRVAVLEDFRTLETVHDGRRRVYRSPVRQDKGHRAAWEAFAAAIASAGPPPIPYDQLFGVTRATFAALEALHTGERVSIRKNA
jgi:predicted dehydrogenase/threonine dehydrogenase-like Zn-dependent dehydrogenase